MAIRPDRSLVFRQILAVNISGAWKMPGRGTWVFEEPESVKQGDTHYFCLFIHEECTNYVASGASKRRTLNRDFAHGIIVSNCDSATSIITKPAGQLTATGSQAAIITTCSGYCRSERIIHFYHRHVNNNLHSTCGRRKAAAIASTVAHRGKMHSRSLNGYPLR